MCRINKKTLVVLVYDKKQGIEGRRLLDLNDSRILAGHPPFYIVISASHATIEHG